MNKRIIKKKQVKKLETDGVQVIEKEVYQLEDFKALWLQKV